MAVLLACSAGSWVGCKARAADARPGNPSRAISAEGTAGPGAKTQRADADPCAWVTAAEAAGILGDLDGRPWRADEATTHPEPKNDGRACVYRLARRDSGPAGGPIQVAIELVTETVTATEGVAAAMEKKLAGEGGASTAQTVSNALGSESSSAGGWDHSEWFAGSFQGRIGAVGVKAVTGDGINAPAASTEQVERLATMIRDRIPDLPIASPRADEFGGGANGGPDPCGLLTRDEVEAALGKLTMPPFRSSSDELANPAGDGCSYYLGHHRVFVVDVSWDNGKTMFKMVSGFGQGIASVVATGKESADTLEGSWDQAAAGPGGSLYFLKGDRMIEVTYLTAAASLPAATRLADLAIKRLSAR